MKPIINYETYQPTDLALDLNKEMRRIKNKSVAVRHDYQFKSGGKMMSTIITWTKGSIHVDRKDFGSLTYRHPAFTSLDATKNFFLYHNSDHNNEKDSYEFYYYYLKYHTDPKEVSKLSSLEVSRDSLTHQELRGKYYTFGLILQHWAHVVWSDQEAIKKQIKHTNLFKGNIKVDTDINLKDLVDSGDKDEEFSKEEDYYSDNHETSEVRPTKIVTQVEDNPRNNYDFIVKKLVTYLTDKDQICNSEGEVCGYKQNKYLIYRDLISEEIELWKKGQKSMEKLDISKESLDRLNNCLDWG